MKPASKDPQRPQSVERGSRQNAWRFILGFGLIAGVLFSLYSFPYPSGSWGQRFSDGYLRAYAHVAAWVLSVFEPRITVSGQDIVGRYGLRIIHGCDAIDAQVLLLAAILAFPLQSWRRRLWGAAIGLLIVTAANVVRICSLYYVGLYAPAYFDLFHHELWPLALIAIAAGTFVLWSRLPPARAEARHVVA